MNLDLAWSVPSPTPGCGYKALYRRKGDPNYTEVDTSGTTLSILVLAPASFEGRLVSDCCSESVSSGTPFGVNGYSPFTITGAVVNSQVQLTVTSTYSSGYDTIIEGTYTLNGSHSFQITYPAGRTNYVATLPGQVQGSVTNLVVTAVSPVFNNGGELQQYDTVNTPPYFKLYWNGDVSGTTWTGAPSQLPSFSLDQFTPTEYAVDGVTVLAGQLNMSYILSEVYSSSYSTLTMEVYDATMALIGTTYLTKSPTGLRQAVITLTKAVSDLDTSTDFTMKILWPDLTLIDTKVFRLPDF